MSEGARTEKGTELSDGGLSPLLFALIVRTLLGECPVDGFRMRARGFRELRPRWYVRDRSRTPL